MSELGRYGEVVRDEEGMQTMRQLGLNMAFLFKSIRLGLQQFGGNGHRVYNESLYLVEGSDRALLIDAGR